MRFDDQHVKKVARDFMDSWQARVWSYVNSDVRRALLDSFVLDQQRLAFEYDEQGKPTGFNDGAVTTYVASMCAFLNFRDRVEAQLRSGVRRGSRSPLVGLTIKEG